MPIILSQFLYGIRLEWAGEGKDKELAAAVLQEGNRTLLVA